MKSFSNRVIFALICTLTVAGCSGDRSVPGGTQGTLKHGNMGLRDMRIEVHAVGNSQPIGFGVTRDGGRFELFESNAQQGLHLQPGEYSFTLESIGPEPIALRPELRQPQRTLLRKTWSESDTALEITLP